MRKSENKKIKISFDKLIFEKFCLLVIFICLELLYIVGFVDLSNEVITLLGLGILLLTIADMFWEDNRIVVKIIYVIGLGIIIISPNIKLESLEKFSVDSTSITLISLIMVIASMMVNQIKRKIEHDRVRGNVIQKNMINNSNYIVTDSAKLIESLVELSKISINLLNLYAEAVFNLIDENIDNDSASYRAFIEKFNEITIKNSEIEKQSIVLEKDHDVLEKRIRTSIAENEKYLIEENYREELSK